MAIDHDLHIQTDQPPQVMLQAFFDGLGDIRVAENDTYEDGRTKYFVAGQGFEAYAVQRLPDETVNRHFLGFTPTVLLWFRLTDEDETAVEIMQMIAQRAKHLAESTGENMALFFNNGIIPMFVYVNQEYQFDNT